MHYLMALSIGIFNVAFWPQLPSNAVMIAVVSVLFLVGLGLRGAARKAAITLLVFFLGVWWAVLMAHRELHYQLPEHLDKQDFLVTGTIASLIDSNDRRSRFSFDVDSVDLLSDNAERVSLRSLLLSWYHVEGAKRTLVPGQRWQIIVRLRRPRGMRNPGGFDYQSWLLQQGYSATGYIRQTESARMLQAAKFSINQYRSQVRKAINSSGLTAIGGAVLVALSIGDRQKLSGHWDDLARLGIVHLLVISGLHIGLVGAIGFLIGTALSRAVLPLHRQFPSLVNTIGRYSGPLMAVLLASGYSLLAGFSLSTQRALIGVMVVMVGKVIFRHVTPLTGMLWGLALIALSQPLAVLSAGFWLSFIAVSLLIWWFAPWVGPQHRLSIKRVFSVQLALLVVMLIPLLFFMGRASWLAPIVNIIAVPWVSFVSVPLTLVGVALDIVWPEMAVKTWQLADHSIAVLWWAVEWLPKKAGFMLTPLAVDRWGLAAAFLAVVGLILPWRLAGRWLCLLPFFTLLVGVRPEPPLRLTVLDVGQGLAIVIEVADKTLVYDAGPNFGDRFSAGSGIIAPYLWRRGRGQIDLLVISHEDGDHSGGLVSLLNAVTVKQILAGPGVTTTAAKHCLAGHSWQWGQGADRIDFTILSPHLAGAVEGNNSSCVLLVKWRDQIILLPGDIEQAVEQDLEVDFGPVNLLVAPHHGSKTSSTDKFVALVHPEHVIFSSGYRHQFGHPHRAVVSRYRRLNSRLWRTSHQGAISFVWDQQGELRVTIQRKIDVDRWWR